MAHAGGTPVMLRLALSPQSGNYTMTAAWQVVYTDSEAMAYLFGSAVFDLSTMAAGDTINIRVRKRLTAGGAWVPHDMLDFNNAQPTNFMAPTIASIPDVNGIEISMQQTAGVLRTIPCEFFDAKMAGLA